ncbi:hypothetical protein BV898_12143 [Hypsibius exemplaris]|uniref:Receptor ligand binding region domain-containing protein n=1 Tax=Hypsibius exemplaris TaxID=2072580 RepID=A0A1W0WEG9_HYPEX|nr:hypothetical protein BV898_12143 [Hypsibius exemplaris]
MPVNNGSFRQLHLLTYGTPGVQYPTAMQYSEPAVELAIHDVRTLYAINVTNHVLAGASQVSCESETGNAYYVPEYVFTHLPGGNFVLISLGCDDVRSLGWLSREWNVPVLFCSSTYPDVYDTDQFPTQVSFGPLDAAQFLQGLFGILAHFSWTSYAVVHDTASYARVFEAFVMIIKKNLILAPRFTFVPIDSSVYPRVLFDKVLDKVQSSARIVILMMGSKPTRELMVMAEKTGRTTGDYVYLCIEPYRDFRRPDPLTWRFNDTDDEIAKSAFRSLLHFTSVCFERSAVADGQLMRRIEQQGRVQYGDKYFVNGEVNEYSIAAYYSVMALAQVTAEMETAAEITNGRTMAARFRNRIFTINDQNVTIGTQGVRIIDYCLKSTSTNSAGSFQAVMRYDVLSQRLRPVEELKIDWRRPGNFPPPSRPMCGFTGDDPACQSIWNTTSIASVVAVLTVMLLAAFAAGAWWVNKRASKSSAEWWNLLPAHYIQTDAARKLSRRESRISSRYADLGYRLLGRVREMKPFTKPIFVGQLS